MSKQCDLCHEELSRGTRCRSDKKCQERQRTQLRNALELVTRSFTEVQRLASQLLP